MSRDPLYLQVRNAQGELLGLMRGPFRIEWLRRGFVSFAQYRPFSVELDESAPVPNLEVINLPVNWWVPAPRSTIAYAVLQTDLPLDELRRIALFR
jgi:hypothetical protein